MEDLYNTAGNLKEDLAETLLSSRNALDAIVKKEYLQKRDEPHKGFNANQVKLDPRMLRSLKEAHVSIDQVISTAQKTI